MESKVLLFNEHDDRVGETFMRRARQLVSQQRAEWVDESHSAIRFAPDAEIESEPVREAADAAGHKKESKSGLYALAEKRLRDRRRFILHTLLLIPEFIVFVLLVAADYEAAYFGFFLAGIFGTLYATNAWNYFNTHVRGFRAPDRAERRARALALEMDKLKRMGYAE